MTLRSQGQGHGGNDLRWVGARHLHFNFDDQRFLILISGYPRIFNTFFCMTLKPQREGHGGNDLGWVGAGHLYLNTNDPRLLVKKREYGISN